MHINNTHIITTKKGRSTFTYTAFDLACAEQMYKRIKAVIPYAQKPNIASWANTLRKMRLIDHIPPSEIGNVFRWANQDDFWQTNILSPAKLRKHFARLHKLMVQEAAQQPRRTRDIPLQQSLTDDSWATGMVAASDSSHVPMLDQHPDALETS